VRPEEKVNLDDYNPIGSLDVEIVGIVYQVSLMLGDNLKAISFRYPNCLHHRPMHTISDAMDGASVSDYFLMKFGPAA
jgi:hypothetical protein